MNLSDKAVEAAARAIRATAVVTTQDGWDAITEELRLHYRQRAIVVLQAAAKADAS